jgi:natural product biosynthesis luciferase-like monooxygenase protein
MRIDNVNLLDRVEFQGIRCVLVGSETLLIECGAILERNGHEIVTIVTDNADIVGWAEARSVPLLPDAKALLADASLPPFDYLFSITNLRILPDAVLALPRRGAINFHDAPLPEYAGLNTPSWALMDGASEYGVTWHIMTPEVDAGSVLVQRRFALQADETALTLNRKCFAAGVESFEALLDGLVAKGPVAVATPGTPQRFFRREDRPEAAGVIRWDQQAERIDRLVRALDFGGYANPLGTARACFDGHPMIVQALALHDGAAGLPPGTIVRIEPEAIVVATASCDVAISRIATLGGRVLAPVEAAAHFGLWAGGHFDVVSTDLAAQLSTVDAAVAVHEGFWRRRLRDLQPLDLPNFDRRAGAVPASFDQCDQHLPASLDPARVDTVMAGIVGFLARIADNGRFDLGFSSQVMRATFDRLDEWFAHQLPLRVDCDFNGTFETLRENVLDDVRTLHRRIGFSSDIAARSPELRLNATDRNPLVLPVAVTIVDRLDEAQGLPGCELTIAVSSDGAACRWLYDAGGIDSSAVGAMQRQFAKMLAAIDHDPQCRLAELPLHDPAELAELLEARNATAGAWRQDACVHHLIAEQARRTPDQIAVTCDGRSLTYRQLDRAADGWARRLNAMGVGPDVLVGLFVDRSVELVIGVLAIHKAGGAYLPLDPAYPADRIGHMIADSQARVLVTQSHLAGRLPVDATLVCIDGAMPEVSEVPFDGGAGPANLAYVIYTSGSTGKPKGVMVEHRNVVNFFAGMDDKIAAPGIWLAVTSLSFDISVLELCWTLTRGFTVVIYTGDDRQAGPMPEHGHDDHADQPLDFSLFYFASDAAETASDKYRLLLEGAKYGDREGFAAVWTPERHFHAFGGLYPNPAVVSAAIAAVTERIQIRAGSVVLPLHHPIRVAEDWSVVDNLSNGRVGISFAAGWQPDDFVLAPEKFKDNKEIMLRDIDVVRRLWRGEAVAFPGPLGHEASISILPRPIQPELPFWLTSAGSIETFEAAGRIGAYVLTHLLGQTIEELTDKLAAYRRAWREAGHAGNGRAALMLHSFVGSDDDAVRAIVRAPLIAYLRSSASLIKQYAWSFPAFKRRPGMDGAGGGIEIDSLDETEMSALLDHACDRYYETSGLFGTPAGCAAMINRVKRAGVDEIACLIDFGVDSATVLAHLPQLNAVRKLAMGGVISKRQDVPALIERHGVTHLQCTPSMASLLLADDRAAPALASLKAMMVGGEAFPPALARDLQRLVGGTVMNMYGPTETTIWSTVETLGEIDAGVPLGKPLRNQQVHVLDRRLRAIPDGVPGELVIGGKGVTRGYLNRPELTAERFVAHPFRDGERVYRTGDLARYRGDGSIEFLGRLDNQVKIRGHRIELGEIEAELAAHPTVREAVVIAREDTPGDSRLVAYVLATADAPGVDLREYLRQRLPAIMVPAQVLMLAALPRTPNGKLDRKALPSPDLVVVATPVEAFVAPAAGIEEQIAAVWRNVLKLPSVGVADNFFDLGGHSLLAVQVHRQLVASIGQGLSITDIFRYPTIRALGARLGAEREDNSAVEMGQSRAQDRRAAMNRRRGGFAAVVASEMA